MFYYGVISKVRKIPLIVFILLFVLISQGSADNLDHIAEGYVRLCLELDLYDPGYVDAYYGPEDWKSEAQKDKSHSQYPIIYLKEKANSLLDSLTKVDTNLFNYLDKRRYDFIKAQLIAIRTRIEYLAGVKYSFDDESRLLFGVTINWDSLTNSIDKLTCLDSIVPGEGELFNRVQNLKANLMIPEDKIDTVFTIALIEARRRTSAHIEIPADNLVKFEFVNGKSWGGYNLYLGNGKGVIQINKDYPLIITEVLSYVCHEAYPGHHLQYSIMEFQNFKKHGWIEYSVVPLYSPLGPLLEGAADYGVEMAFPNSESVKFEKEVLCPLAGIDTNYINLYHEISKYLNRWNLEFVFIAREYLNGRLNRDDAIAKISSRFLLPMAEAENALNFADEYRSYLVNYGYGLKLIRNYFDRVEEKHLLQPDESYSKWNILWDLFAEPNLPSNLLVL